MEKTVQHKSRTLSFFFLVVAILAVGAFYHQLSLSGKVVDRSGGRLVSDEEMQTDTIEEQPSALQSTTSTETSSLQSTLAEGDYYDLSGGPLGASLSGVCNEVPQVKCPEDHTLTCKFSYDVYGDRGKCQDLSTFVENLCAFLKDQAEEKAKDHAKKCSLLTVSVNRGGKEKLVSCAGDTGSVIGAGSCHDKLNPAPGKSRDDYKTGDGYWFATLSCEKSIRVSCNYGSAFEGVDV